jgi:hypothetical protein
VAPAFARFTAGHYRPGTEIKGDALSDVQPRVAVKFDLKSALLDLVHSDRCAAFLPLHHYRITEHMAGGKNRGKSIHVHDVV